MTLMFKKTVTALTCWVICGLALVQANSAEEDVWVITYLEPPFIMKDRGNVTGYAAEVVREILQGAGIDSRILSTRWERLEKEARTKANVIAFALARTQEREEHYHWITPLTANMFGVYAHGDKARTVSALEELAQYESVIVLKGDAREKILRAAGLKNVFAFDYWPDGVEYFMQNPNTVIFFSDAGMRIYCKAVSSDCDNTKRIYGHDVRASYLAVSKPGTSMQLVENLKQSSKAFKSSPEFQVLAETWLNTYRETTDLPMHLDNGVVNLWTIQQEDQP